jgi:N-acyl-D-amino-acid deacylase
MKLAELPLEQRIVELRKPEVRGRILSEESTYPVPQLRVVIEMIHNGLDKIFRLGDPPDYEPPPEASCEAQARKLGIDPHELLYDWLLEMDGRQLLMLTLLNYSELNLDAVREMLLHPRSAFGLADGGAHCGAICDASMTTSLLSHWARDRTRGEKLPIGFCVRKMTKDTASLYGLDDRGVLAPGMKGDANVIDFDRLGLEIPVFANDLPAGAGRLIQRARGYEATIVSGQVTFRNGEPTGALPGRLVRGAQRPA